MKTKLKNPIPPGTSAKEWMEWLRFRADHLETEIAQFTAEFRADADAIEAELEEKQSAPDE